MTRKAEGKTHPEKMKFTAVLAATVATTALAENPFEAPSFCHDLDCPSFTTRTVSGDVQVRSYDTLKWASTDVESDSAETAGNIAFQRLFGYLSGANENSQKIDMTAPVLNYITPGSGPNCNSTFTVSFFVPWEFQKDGPPAPTAADVYIEEKIVGDVAVTEYGGFANKDNQIIETAEKLYQDIYDSKDVDFADDDRYFFVAYDSPYTLFNRHNEDWIRVKDIE
jgi:hypothetical protein